jgi:hypothetical protein
MSTACPSVSLPIRGRSVDLAIMSDASRMRPARGAARQLLAPGPLATAAAWLVSVLVLCVSLARGDCLLRQPPCLTAHGERTWLRWAYRHPEPQQLFQRIGSQLRPGEPIVIVAPAAVDETYWWRAMAGYFLPGHPIAALSDRDPRHLGPPPRPSAGGPAWVIVTAGGQVRVLRAAT